MINFQNSILISNPRQCVDSDDRSSIVLWDAKRGGWGGKVKEATQAPIDIEIFKNIEDARERMTEYRLAFEHMKEFC